MEKDPEKIIDELLKNKKLNLFRGDDKEFDYSKIPFDIPALDRLTAGGIAKKRLTLIYGPTNVGKSYLASQICANVLNAGGKAAWIDTELSWDSAWMKRCGIDTTKIIVGQPESGEEALEAVRTLLDASFDVVVLDSIAGLVPHKNLDEDFSFNPMAWQARFVNSSLPKILPSLSNGGALVAINQVRSSIGPVALDNMPGGLAQSFFAHALLQVRRKGWIEDNGSKVGFDMEVRLRKTKIGGENWSSALVPFRVDGGIDILESYIREAIGKKLITQAGPWYTYKEQKYMGLNGIKKIFLDDAALQEELKVSVT
jgi:recombination protein RecA